MLLRKTRPGLLVATLTLLGGQLFAQVTSGNIVGTVYDPTGATVPNAPVTATNEATGVASSTTSTSTGEYRIPNVPAGAYTVTVNAAGFAKAKVADVQVPLNQTVTANVTLQVGQTATTVEVSTAAVAIDTSTAQVQETFETKQMMDLPTASSGSGVINLSLLNAGVASSGGIGQGTGPSIGGQRPTNNNYTVEGVDINNKSVTGPVLTIPNDAVAEFTVLQNQFSPEFGHSSGGQFNQVVKSGTNSFHGALYEYNVNRDYLAADNLSAVLGTPLHPRYDDNRFGGNFGGPIKRNKLFFFVNYEYEPFGQLGGATQYFAPTQEGYAMLAAIPGINQTNLQQLQKYMGTGATATTEGLPLTSTIQVGPGNRSLGTGAWAGSGAGLTTIPVGSISVAAPNFSNTSRGVASLDYNLSDKDSIRGRYIFNRFGGIDTSGFPAEFYTTIPSNAYVVEISEYHTFSPAVTNELRLGYNRLNQNFPVTGQKFPGLDQFPTLAIYDLNINNWGPDPNAPQYGIQNTWQGADSVSWVKGNHSLKFGFDGWRSISPQNFLQRSRGDYEWTYLSDFLFDNFPDAVAQRSVGTGVYSGDQYLLGWFGNDSWKIRPNLTINIGVRYEYLTVPYTETLQKLNAAASTPGLITFGNPKTQKNAWMPRVGIAWSPGTTGKTSIRAGFGRNYDILYDNLGILSEPPVFNSTIDVTGQSGTGFLANGGIIGAYTPPTDPATLRANTASFVPDQRRPESLQWNFGVQHVFGENYTFESRYLGSRGIDLPMQDRINIQAVVNKSNQLPTYLTAPSQATLDSLPNTLSKLETAFNNGGYLLQPYLDYGYYSPIVGFMPVGNSTYHGWANQLTRRFASGLQFVGAYTWSHNIDDSTATAFTTVLTPRRPEDFQNLKLDRASSGLDHRQRFTFEMIYDVPFFKNSNWFMKNIVGNWEIAPVYTYQTGTLVTVQSGTDSNLNTDSATDRTIINPSGSPYLGSNVTSLKNSNGDVVAYLATNPNAMYIKAGLGTLPNAARDTMHLNPINDIDATAAKRFNVTERFALEFSARVGNVLNHPQYVGGFINDVAPLGFTGGLQRQVMEPQATIFHQPSQAFSSNPRGMALALKLTF